EPARLVEPGHSRKGLARFGLRFVVALLDEGEQALGIVDGLANRGAGGFEVAQRGLAQLALDLLVARRPHLGAADPLRFLHRALVEGAQSLTEREAALGCAKAPAPRRLQLAPRLRQLTQRQVSASERIVAGRLAGVAEGAHLRADGLHALSDERLLGAGGVQWQPVGVA